MSPRLPSALSARVSLALLLVLGAGLLAGVPGHPCHAAEDPSGSVTAGPSPEDAEEGGRNPISLQVHVSEDTGEEGSHEETQIRIGVNGGGAFELSHPIVVGPADVMKDDVVSIGSEVDIQGEVRGDVVVIGGTLKISGRVEGDTVALFTDTHLSDTAVVDGQFVHIGGEYDVSPLATVHGERVHLEGIEFGLGRLNELGDLDLGEEARAAGLGLLRCVYAFKLIRLGLLFGVMLLIVGLLPQRVIGAGEALREIWGRAIFMGLLAYAAYFVLMCIFGLLCIILIGIPLVGLLGLAWLGVKAFGLASILRLFGDHVARTFLHREVKPLAALSIGFLIFLPTQIIPFYWGVIALSLSLLGALLGTALVVLSAGLCLVTQFGAVTTFVFPQPKTGPPSAPLPPAGPPSAPAEGS